MAARPRWRRGRRRPLTSRGAGSTCAPPGSATGTGTAAHRAGRAHRGCCGRPRRPPGTERAGRDPRPGIPGPPGTPYGAGMALQGPPVLYRDPQICTGTPRDPTSRSGTPGSIPGPLQPPREPPEGGTPAPGRDPLPPPPSTPIAVTPGPPPGTGSPLSPPAAPVAGVAPGPCAARPGRCRVTSPPGIPGAGGSWGGSPVSPRGITGVRWAPAPGGPAGAAGSEGRTNGRRRRINREGGDVPPGRFRCSVGGGAPRGSPGGSPGAGGRGEGASPAWGFPPP